MFLLEAGTADAEPQRGNESAAPELESLAAKIPNKLPRRSAKYLDAICERPCYSRRPARDIRTRFPTFPVIIPPLWAWRIARKMSTLIVSQRSGSAFVFGGKTKYLCAGLPRRVCPQILGRTFQIPGPYSPTAGSKPNNRKNITAINELVAG